jgi:hypothetical protein
MQNRYHIIDVNCRVRGGQDYGAVRTYEEAVEKILDLERAGHTGGCRCRDSGWKIRTCEEIARIHTGYFVDEHKTQSELFQIPPEVWAAHACTDFSTERWQYLETDY